MIRKAIIVLLTLGAMVTAYESVASYRRLFSCGWVLGDSDQVFFLTKTGSLILGRNHSVEGVPGMTSMCVVQNVPNVYGYFKLSHLWKVEFKGRAIQAPPGGRRFEIEFPLWLPAVIFATYPTIAFIGRKARRRRRRQEQGLCVGCGYDLTGNESGVCPECGEAIRSKTV